MCHVRAFALVFVAAFAACAPGRGVVLVTVDGEGATVEGVDQLRVVVARGSESAGPYFFRPKATTIPPAFTFSLSLPRDVTGSATITVDALDADRAVVGTGTRGVDVVASEVTPLRIPVASAVQCANHLRDFGETDVDCGGPCAPCDDGRACAANGDCCSKTCEARVCRTVCGAGQQCKAGRCVGVGFTGRQVTTGYGYACVIRLDDTVTCFGNLKMVKDERVLSPPRGAFRQIDGGYFHACGVRTDETIACWGKPEPGGAAPPAGAFAEVSSGEYDTCARRADGRVTCWGEPMHGITEGTPTDRFKRISVGSLVACGIRMDDTLGCWGTNQYHLLDVVPTGRFTQVSAGSYGVCAVRAEDQSIACWGADEYGQLQPPVGRFRMVHGGDDQFTAIGVDGALAYWGYDQTGARPVPAGAFEQVDMGWTFPCAVRADQVIVCWTALAPPLPMP